MSGGQVRLLDAPDLEPVFLEHLHHRIVAGKVTRASIGLGGVAKSAVRAASVEKALNGTPFDRVNVERAAKQAAHDIDPSDDAYASAWYRARVTPVHIRRALIGE